MDIFRLHLGFYEDNCGYESIALKRHVEDIWDIFFDFKGYGIKYITPNNELTLEPFGTRIFSIYSREMEYDMGVQQFKQWLTINKII